MNIRIRPHSLCLAALLLMPFTFSSAEPVAHGEHAAGAAVERLSPKLRHLLQREMQALQGGMNAIVPALVTGEWGTVREIGLKMQASYLLKQQLDAAQAAELHATLPETFLAQDREFHYLAGMLAHAAEARKVELVGFYLSRMTEACVNCHSAHASHRFPAFATPPSPAAEGHHH